MATAPRPGERLVTLLDGRQVSNYSEEHRHECEARFIMSLPTLAARRRLLYGVRTSIKRAGKWVDVQEYRGIQQVRGPDAVRRLEATMMALWRARSGHQAAPANDNATSTSAQQG